MDSLIYLIITVLTGFIALNMFLTFKLLTYVKNQEEQARAHDLVAGEEISNLPLISNKPMVLVYIEPRCPKCIGKVPELEGLLQASNYAGVDLHITSIDKPRRIKKILKTSTLAQQLLTLTTKQHFMLNPFKVSPFYLFIDEQKKLQASGLIGDANWQSFSEQMAELQADYAEKEAA